MKFYIRVLSCCCFFPALLSAQTTFKKWDKNNDGKLSREELPEGLRRNFDRVDKNGDGAISEQEDRDFRSRGKTGDKGRPFSGSTQKLANLSYAENDNPRQALDLYLPKDGTKLPVVCWIHGGGWRNGSKDNVRRLQPFLESGKYAVATIGYRLTDEAQWPSQIQDCKASIRFLKANAEKYRLDPDRIAVWGSSAGGHLVAMLGVSHDVEHLEGGDYPNFEVDSKVNCVVDFFGPTELLKMNQQGSTMDHDSATSPESLLVGGAIQTHIEKTRDASPIHHVTADDEPFLIVHGTADGLVPHQQSVEFEKALEQTGVATTFISVTGGGHGAGFPPEVTNIVKQFVDFHLLGIGETPADQKLESVR